MVQCRWQFTALSFVSICYFDVCNRTCETLSPRFFGIEIARGTVHTLISCAHAAYCVAGKHYIRYLRPPKSVHLNVHILPDTVGGKLSLRAFDLEIITAT